MLRSFLFMEEYKLMKIKMQKVEDDIQNCDFLSIIFQFLLNQSKHYR